MHDAGSHQSPNDCSDAALHSHLSEICLRGSRGLKIHSELVRADLSNSFLDIAMDRVSLVFLKRLLAGHANAEADVVLASAHRMEIVSHAYLLYGRYCFYHASYCAECCM